MGISGIAGGGGCSSAKWLTLVLAGIAFQLGMTILFALLMLDFWVRYARNKAYPARWKGFWRRRRTEIDTSIKDKEKGKDSDSQRKRLDEHGDNTSPRPESPAGASSACNSSTSSTTAVERPRDKPDKVEVIQGPHKPYVGQPPEASAGPDTENQVYAGTTETPAPRRSCKPHVLLLSLAFATTTLIVRGIYRTVELRDGWSGPIITTQRYFVWLDGFLMALCMGSLAVAHPGFLLPRRTWAHRGRQGESGGATEATEA